MRFDLAILTVSFRLVSAILMALASVCYKPGPWELEEAELVVEVSVDNDVYSKEEMNERDSNLGYSNPAISDDSNTKM